MAGSSFSALVSTTEWRSDVEAWVLDRVEERGDRVTGPLDQRRITPWSTQLIVPTASEQLWFKALCPAMAFEPALQQVLSQLAPTEVDRPYALDVDRGWMLTNHRGSTLGDSHEPATGDWCAVVEAAARLQRRVADHRDAILATGVPDCSPPTVPGRFERLVEEFASLPPDHPSHVDDDLRSRLEATAPRLRDACEALSASPMPSTIQHGDLHPWNVFVTDTGSLRIFDFGDVQWAPALEVLSVPYGVIADGNRVPWKPVRDAYVSAWADVVDSRDVDTLWDATAFTQPVNRAQTWWDALAGATDEEWAEWGIAPVHHLSRILDA